ncbi:winged helix-turn-helix domain-containing protein [Enterococcus crotali]|uniref:winged helix-turn-helix domain-containing protein n=1 Tax=Enterococcus crotali TaxID=1453587 RepID=UPI00046E7095|nr:winged helix-turn-helix domain-containing protein [Enterococcus crotali]
MDPKLIAEIINVPEDFDKEKLNDLNNSGISIRYAHSYINNTKNPIKKHIDFFIIIEDHLSLMEVFEIITSIRKYEQGLIFLLVEPEHEQQKLFYLKIGADIVVKIDETWEILKYMMLNLGRQKVYEKPMLTKNNQLVLNDYNLSVAIEGEEVFLTKNEFRLLRLLNKTPNITISYREINEYLWNKKNDTQVANIANIVFNLRDKLKQIEGADHYLVTIRSKGYMLNIRNDCERR